MTLADFGSRYGKRNADDNFKGGRSQFRKTGQKEFKDAFTTPDGIRKHMRVLTANP
jgi:hypothetical protein